MFGWTVLTMFLEIIIFDHFGRCISGLLEQTDWISVTVTKIIFLVIYISFSKTFMQLQAIYLGMDRVFRKLYFSFFNSH